MSEVRLVIREAARDWSGTIHGSVADQAVAALSADPATFEELQIAMSRFAKPSPTFGVLSNLSRRTNDEPYDAGLVVIDLVARLIVIDSTYSSPRPSRERFAVIPETSVRTLRCSIVIWPTTGSFCPRWASWRFVGDRVRKERTGKPLQLDVRSVFYGRPLYEFIAQEMLRRIRASRRNGIGIDRPLVREERVIDRLR